MFVRKIILGIAIVIALPLSTAWSTQAWEGPGAMGVKVKGRGGRLEGAMVTLRYHGSGGPVEAQTNKKGEARLQGLALGEWEVEIHHHSHMTFVARVRLPRDGKAQVVFAAHQAAGASGPPMSVKFFKVKGRRASVPAPPTQVAVVPKQPAAPQRPKSNSDPVRTAEPVYVAPESEEEAVAEIAEPKPQAPEVASVHEKPQGEIEKDEPLPEPIEKVAPVPPPTVAVTSVEEPSAPPVEVASTPAPEQAPVEEESQSATPESSPAEAAVLADVEEKPMGAQYADNSSSSQWLRESGTCPDCKPGESAVSVGRWVQLRRQNVACSNSIETLNPLVREICGSSRLGEYVGPIIDPDSDRVFQALGEVAPSLAEALLGDEPCEVVAVVLPPGAKYTGYSYGARDSLDRGACISGNDCQIGAARWVGDPVVEKGAHRTVVYGYFENHSPEEARFAELTVYFK